MTAAPRTTPSRRRRERLRSGSPRRRRRAGPWSPRRSLPGPSLAHRAGGRAARARRLFGSRTANDVRPPLSYAVTIRPSPRNPYERLPRLHAGYPNSASAAWRTSRSPSRTRSRFHQPLRSLANDEVAGGAPLGLPDRLLADPAGDERGRASHEVDDEELAAVPGHPGQVPREERETRAVRGDPRRCVEVAPAGDYLRLRRAVGWNGDQLVDHVLAVTLAHADPEAAVRRDDAVRVAMPPIGDVRRDRNRPGVRLHAVQPLIVVPCAVGDACLDAERSAAVVVHQRADAEIGGDGIHGTRAG